MLSGTDITPLLAAADVSSSVETAPVQQESPSLDLSALETAETETTTPLPTPNVTVGRVTNTTVNFSWDYISNAQGYSITYSVNGVQAGTGWRSWNSMDFQVFIADGKPGDVVTINVVAEPYGGYGYVESEAGEASATLVATPVITLTPTQETISCHAPAGTVVATFAYENVDPSKLEVRASGWETELFKIEGDKIVTTQDACYLNTQQTISINYDGWTNSNYFNLEVTGKLQKPVVEVVNVGTDSVSLSWEGVKGVTDWDSYVVEYAVGNSKAFTTEWTQASSDTTNSYTIEGLRPGTDYRIRVRAKNSSFQSDAAYVSATTLEIDPTISISQAANTAATTAVGKTVATFDAFSIDPSTVKLLDNGVETDLFAIDGNRIVVAKNLASGSASHQLKLVSGEVSSEEIELRVSLAKPAAKLDNATYESLSVSWEAVPDAAAYSVQYALGDSKEFTVVEVPADQLSYTIEGLSAKTGYRVRVRAIAPEYGIQSVASYVEASTTGVEPLLEIVSCVTNVSYDAVGTRVLGFSCENIDRNDIKILDNGVETDAFKIVGNEVVVAKSLLYYANPHQLQLVAGDLTVDAPWSFVAMGQLESGTLTVVEATTENVTLSWTAIPLANAYKIEFWNASWEKVVSVTVPAERLSYTVNNLDPQGYRIFVQGIAEESGITSQAMQADVYLEAAEDNASLEEAQIDELDSVFATLDSDAFFEEL